MTTAAIERPPIGVLLGSTLPPAGLQQLGHLVEDAGFSEIWVAEDYFYTGGIAASAVLLGATHEIPVGFGVVSTQVRHPVVLAMEIATLAQLFPGRLRAGLGLGLPSALKRVGMLPAVQLRAVRDRVAAIRGLLTGAPVTMSGIDFSLDAVRLAWPAPEVPVYLGATGPKMLELAGEIADGTVGSLKAGVAYIRWARQKIAKGSGSPGAERPFRVFAIFSCHQDGVVARLQARRQLALYLSMAPSSPTTAVYGIEEELATLAAGGMEHLMRNMPDQWVEDLTVAGTPDECVGKLRAMLDAGAASVSLFPVAGNIAEQLTLAGQRILPDLM